MSKNKVTSVIDFLNEISNLTPLNENSTRFFRGQSNHSWEMEPSIYRIDNNAKDPKYLIKNEHNIISEAFISCPDEFANDKCLFDKLVRLQHYNYPTRLLDITYSALVALYFAVCDNKENDGKVFLLDIPNKSIKYRDSDTVSILSALAYLNINISINDIEKNSLIHIQKENLRILTSKYILSQSENTLLKAYKELYGDERTLKTFGDYKKIDSFNDKKVIKIAYNSHDDILKLVSIIKMDKPGFNNILNIYDLDKTLCVKPSINNQRIARQQGAFLLFGIGKEGKYEPSKIHTEWQQNEIIIDAESKDNILKELEQLGIHYSFLFPELEKQAESIKEKYKR